MPQQTSQQDQSPKDEHNSSLYQSPALFLRPPITFQKLVVISLVKPVASRCNLTPAVFQAPIRIMLPNNSQPLTAASFKAVNASLSEAASVVSIKSTPSLGPALTALYSLLQLRLVGACVSLNLYWPELLRQFRHRKGAGWLSNPSGAPNEMPDCPADGKFLSSTLKWQTGKRKLPTEALTTSAISYFAKGLKSSL